MDLLEILLVAAALGSLVTYHMHLLREVRRCPGKTAIGYANRSRQLWVKSVLDERRDILAVQTLRNWSMAASFLASTAVLLTIGILSFLLGSGQVPTILHELNFFGSTDETLFTLKTLLLVLCFLTAFFNFSLSLRYFNHVALDINVPVPDAGERVDVGPFVKALGEATNAKHGRHPNPELQGAHGLHDEIVAAGLERPLARLVVIATGEEHDGHVGLGPIPHQGGELQAVDLGHDHVEKDEVRAGVEGVEGAGPIRGDRGNVAELGEHGCHPLAGEPIVVDDENSGAGRLVKRGHTLRIGRWGPDLEADDPQIGDIRAHLKNHRRSIHGLGASDAASANRVNAGVFSR